MLAATLTNALLVSCHPCERRQEAASCSGRGLSQLTCRRRPPLRVFGRRAAAAVRCAALADNEAYEDEQQEWGQTTKVFDFTYMSAEEAAAEEAASAAAWRQGMDEYAALQEWLLFRTWRFGLLFAGYLLLAASGEVRRLPVKRMHAPLCSVLELESCCDVSPFSGHSEQLTPPQLVHLLLHTFRP